MAGPLQIEGAQSAPSDFAPLHVNRMVTGYWTNTNPLRDAATEMFTEKFYGGRQDRIAAGRNAEISSKLTLRRRPGSSVYNSQIFPPINRFFGWNTFTLTDEAVRVMVDTAATVYDGTGPSTKTTIWTKSPGAGSTYFLGVGNTLYFTNGVENKQLNNATGVVSDWGIVAPTTAPTVTQGARPNPYGTWQPNTVFSAPVTGAGVLPPYRALLIQDSNGGIEQIIYFGTTGSTEPAWVTFPAYSSTPDGSATWSLIMLPTETGWQAGRAYDSFSSNVVIGSVIDSITGLPVPNFFLCTTSGTSGSSEPTWLPGVGTVVSDGSNGLVWENRGAVLLWATDIGPDTPIIEGITIVDSNGYLQTAEQAAKSGSYQPTWATEPGAYTTDGGITWVNAGNFASATTAPWRYGYAFKNSSNKDISNMSPPSAPISVNKGGEVIVQGQGSADPQVDTIVLYRTTQGGSTFFLLDEIPNPGATLWTYTDTTPDSGLTIEIQAQVAGEGTPLPVGATCLEYHQGRIYAAVGNVVWISSGPDAVVSGSSGNAGFDTTFTAQSKITRFWVSSLGVIVFTVRDAYIIQGTGTTSDPLYMDKYIENLPLLNYDAFAIFLTTPYLLTGHKMINALDPSAGITEASFPIADQIAALNPKTAYVTFHSGPTGETALYVADGATQWYRMAPTSAPESGLNWNPPAILSAGSSAVQSVETAPGTMTLLIGPASSGPILMRDTSVNTDNGLTYPAFADIGNIVLAHTGQLAGLAWIALESEAEGTPTQLAVMLDETKEKTGSKSAQFAAVPRTRQDPPNAEPSDTIYSNRHSLLQNQKPVWCKSLKMRLEWPAEDAANELDTYAIFGQVWAEQRSQ
jgi:hypothetical protein